MEFFVVVLTGEELSMMFCFDVVSFNVDEIVESSDV